MKLQPIHRYSIGPNMTTNIPVSDQFYLTLKRPPGVRLDPNQFHSNVIRTQHQIQLCLSRYALTKSIRICC